MVVTTGYRNGSATRLPRGTRERPGVGDRLLDRLDLTKRLTSLLENDEIVVGGIAHTCFDLYGAGHRPQNFYMLGSMGLAVPIGLGLALAHPERQVIVLEGDGSLLMNLGILTTVAMVAPPNLTIVVWDNEAYQTTGGQATATQAGADLVSLASGAGIERSEWAEDETHFEELIRQALWADGPSFVGVKVARVSSKAHPEFDPVFLKLRFMQGIGVS